MILGNTTDSHQVKRTEIRKYILLRSATIFSIMWHAVVITAAELAVAPY